MPSFSFTPVEKKVIKIKEKKSVDNKVKILKKDVYGVIFIDIEGNYSVKVDNVYHKINPKCFNTQGVEKLYLQRLSKDGYREIFARPLDLCYKTDEKHYLPFNVGCEVLGNIEENNITKNIFFNILKVEQYSTNPDCKIALNFYKENYETIQNNRGLTWKTK